MIKSNFFDMGDIYVTTGINEMIKADYRFRLEVNISLQRYSVKDWGYLDKEDKQANDEVLESDDNDIYLFGAYKTSKGEIYIITHRISETSREVATTVCFPEER